MSARTATVNVKSGNKRTAPLLPLWARWASTTELQIIAGTDTTTAIEEAIRHRFFLCKNAFELSIN
jgi:hypothetical protein